ncbi:MAG TPA: glycosyltransferase family 9 protein [Gemmataceae bacterium]|nr:glycosyltransferase family 9 protein [Gemmataceae bacterium]
MPGRSRPPLFACTAERIALLKPSALGDIIHSLPVLTALRQRFPHAHITWVVNQAYEPLLHGHRDLDDTLPFDRRASHRGWRAAAQSSLRFLKELRQRRFDLVIDLQGLFRTALMATATGAQRRVGLSTAREGATWSYTDVIPVADFNALHAVDRCWLIAEAFGAGDVPRQFHIPISDKAHVWAGERTKGCPRPWLMLGPGSRWVTKRWLPEHFAALASRVQSDFGGTVFFVGGGDETPLATAIQERLHGPSHILTGRTTLPQLAALLSRADVMLANDTGPLHLAAALGRPVVAPYTCTKVRRNGPYGAERGAVESTVWCQGSYVKRCSRMECMVELTPDRLWPVLVEVLHSWQRRNQAA